MGKAIKVLHVLTSTRYSGAENVACQIINGFMAEGNFYEMLYCSPDGQIRDALADWGVSFVPLESWSIRNLKKAIKMTKPDIIHAHDMKASLFSAILCGSIPLISHVHNNNFDSRGITPKAVLYSFAAHKAKHIFWVSKSAYEGYAFHNRFRDKSSVLYNVIDREKLQKKVGEDMHKYDYDIVFLGRLTYQKNPFRLIDVLSKASEKHPQMKAAVIGTGDMDAEVKKEVEQAGKQSNIDILGFNSNPYRILHDSKVMIMTSRWEGLPMCAIEAMSLGVPIVSTPTDGLKELIDNGITGYLSDNDEVLAAKVVEILKDEKLHKRLSDNCLKKAEELLDYSKFGNAIETEYKKALGKQDK